MPRPPPPHPVPGSGGTRRAMCFPLPPASLARTGSRPAPNAVSHWANVGQGPASHQKAMQLHALSPSCALLGLGGSRGPIGCASRGVRTRLAGTSSRGRHAAGVHGSRGRRGRAGGGQEEGCSQWRRVFWFGFFFFFFRERSLLWPRLKAAASSCPLPRPSVHTSWCRLQSAFR